jgi:hypothetical protein
VVEDFDPVKYIGDPKVVVVVVAPDIPNPLDGKKEVSGCCMLGSGCFIGDDPIVEAYLIRPSVADSLSEFLGHPSMLRQQIEDDWQLSWGRPR